MALQLYWYDLVCFAIVGLSMLCALSLIWRHKHKASPQQTLLAHGSCTQLWSSCWEGVTPKWLLLTRCTSFLILAGFLAWDIAEWGPTIFVYYTEWTFTLVLLYFAMGIIASAHGCCLSSNQPPCETTEFMRSCDLEESRRASITDKVGIKLLLTQFGPGELWGCLMQTAFQTCGGAVVMTDVVFWCVIVPFLSNSHLRVNVLMGCMHTLNLVFLVLDTALNSLAFPWFGVAYFVMWSCVYVIFQWVIHACGFSWWPYPFLELDTPYAPLWYLCLAVMHIPCYALYAFIARAKHTFLPKLFPHSIIS